MNEPLGSSSPSLFSTSAICGNQVAPEAAEVRERSEHPDGGRAKREHAEELDAVAGGAAQQEVLAELTIRRVRDVDFADVLDQELQRRVDEVPIDAPAAHADRQHDAGRLAHEPCGERRDGAHRALRQRQRVADAAIAADRAELRGDRHVRRLDHSNRSTVAGFARAARSAWLATADPRDRDDDHEARDERHRRQADTLDEHAEICLRGEVAERPRDQVRDDHGLREVAEQHPHDLHLARADGLADADLVRAAPRDLDGHAEQADHRDQERERGEPDEYLIHARVGLEVLVEQLVHEAALERRLRRESAPDGFRSRHAARDVVRGQAHDDVLHAGARPELIGVRRRAEAAQRERAAFDYADDAELLRPVPPRPPGSRSSGRPLPSGDRKPSCCARIRSITRLIGGLLGSGGPCGGRSL